MTIESSNRGKAAVLKVSGRMDAESAPQFEQACRTSIRDGATRLVVDIAALEYVSSIGLRSFLMIAKTLQSSGGAMVLCGLRGLVKEVFDMTHLTPLFQLSDSVDTAVAGV